MNTFRTVSLVALFALVPLTVGCAEESEPTEEAVATNEEALENGRKWVPVEGSGVDYLTTAHVHSQVFTATGMTQEATETVELVGGLQGRLLYHVTSEFDFVAGTMVNTGEQVFSGTVLGSDPVLIHDDSFRFDVNLNTGEETGVVFLDRRLDGPNIECELDVVGTGFTPEGNPQFTYTGECKM